MLRVWRWRQGRSSWYSKWAAKISRMHGYFMLCNLYGVYSILGFYFCYCFSKRKSIPGMHDKNDITRWSLVYPRTRKSMGNLGRSSLSRNKLYFKLIKPTDSNGNVCGIENKANEPVLFYYDILKCSRNEYALNFHVNYCSFQLWSSYLKIWHKRREYLDDAILYIHFNRDHNLKPLKLLLSSKK